MSEIRFPPLVCEAPRELEVGDSSTETDNESNTLDVTVDQEKKEEIFCRGIVEERDGHRREVIHEESVQTQHLGF